jgi:UDP-N-acetylmuramoylalanine--D-glutamate ligase
MPLVRPSLPSGPFLVVGLARSGVAVALTLAARGERVIGVDSSAVAARPELEAAGVLVDAPSDVTAHLDAVATVVKSPGVPQTAPVVLAARAAGIPVCGELEIAWLLLDTPWIAVTGSNGKTTTVEWIGHIHREAGLAAVVAGNVGTPLSSLVGLLDPGTVVVAEASSFQLEDTLEFAPDAAVLLNVTDDHLDRHGTLAAYTGAKLEVFARQGPEGVAVLPAGFPGELGVHASGAGPAAGAAGGQAERITFGRHGDVTVEDGVIAYRGAPLLGVADLGLRGAHNVENALAVAGVCLARGIDPDAVRAGLRSFRGVPHRLEEVARVDGVLYVNDSKATNVASAATGIASFEGGVHAILGGRGKGADYRPLAQPVAARCAAVYLIGEAGPAIGEALAGTGVPRHECGDLASAVAAARAAAQPGDVVLLSPACASFDQFDDFEARGDHFRGLVRAD